MKKRLPWTLLIYLSCSLALAVTVEKNGTTGALSDSDLWEGGAAPGAGDVAAWVGSSAKGYETTPLLLGSNTSWAGISHNFAGNGVLYIGGDAERKTLTLGTSGISLASGNGIVFDADVVIGGNQQWSTTPEWGIGSSISILGDLKGSGSLSTNRGGIVSVSVKGSASSYTGSLEIGEASRFTFENGLTGGNIKINNDSTLSVAVQGVQIYSSNLSTLAWNSGPIFSLTSGHLTLAGTNSFGAGSTPELGNKFSLELQAAASSTLEFQTGVSTFSGSTRVSGGGSVLFGGTTSFAQKIEISGEGTTISFHGSKHKISTAGSIVVRSGSTLDLTQGQLSFDGYTNKDGAILIQGTLRLSDFTYGGSVNQLADYAWSRHLDGGIIEITGETHSTGQGITITGSGGSFLVANQSSILTLNGNGNTSMMNFTGDGTLKLGGVGNLVLNAHTNHSFFNGSGVLEKVGAGTLTINGASNEFSGKMILSEGKLVLNHEAALGGASSLTDFVYKGGVLDMGNLALKNIAIEFVGTSISDVINGGNFLGLLNVGQSGSYGLSEGASFGSGFKASVDTEFVLQENLSIGFKASGLNNYIQGSGLIGISGEGFDLSVSNYGATKGAIEGGALSFHDMGNISFSGNISTSEWGRGGAATAISDTIIFERVGDITFMSNQSHGTLGDGMGGGFYAFGGGYMDGVGNVRFSSNSSASSGGSIATDGSFSFLNAKAVVFEGNESKGGSGGAIYVGTDSLTFDSVSSLSVKNNKAAESGGAFYAQGDISVSNIFESIKFSNNQSTGMKGGAIASENGNVSFSAVEDISFTSNSAGGSGGAISAWGDAVFDGVGNVTFEGNSAEYGGAISADAVSFQNLNGDVVFRNNTASVQGGALSVNYQLDLTADGGDISFAGNTGEGIANSIYFAEDGIVANLDALIGHSIVFEDGWSTNRDDSVITVNVNGKGADSTGQVKMTGEGSQMNVRANTTISQGSFVVEKGANYGYHSSDWSQEDLYLKTEFLMNGGAVVAGENSSINSSRIHLEAGAVLCVTQNAMVRAETIDINGGLVTSSWGVFGQTGQLGGSLQADVITINGISLDINNSPISFSGSVINLGGFITLNDSQVEYTSVDWLTDKEFILGSFGDDSSRIIGAFGGIVSDTSGKSYVYDPNDAGRILGNWELTWRDHDLVASWTASSQPVPESSSCLLLLFSLAAGAMRRRR